MRLPKNMPGLSQPVQEMYRQIRNEIRQGKNGTLILDDGANWRLTLVFTDGKLTAVTTAASTAATASWSDA